jgi:hypothetical protein
MAHWGVFAGEAPHTSEVFTRRHAATGNLCLLATLRSDGSLRSWLSLSPSASLPGGDKDRETGQPDGRTDFTR